MVTTIVVAIISNIFTEPSIDNLALSPITTIAEFISPSSNVPATQNTPIKSGETIAINNTTEVPVKTTYKYIYSQESGNKDYVKENYAKEKVSTGLWVYGNTIVNVFSPVNGSKSKCYGRELPTKILGDHTGKWYPEFMEVSVYSMWDGTMSKCIAHELPDKIVSWYPEDMRVPVYGKWDGIESECTAWELPTKIKSGNWLTKKMYTNSN